MDRAEIETRVKKVLAEQLVERLPRGRRDGSLPKHFVQEGRGVNHAETRVSAEKRAAERGKRRADGRPRDGRVLAARSRLNCARLAAHGRTADAGGVEARGLPRSSGRM